MECKTARLFLPLSAELGHEYATALQDHLAVCPECDACARATQREDAHFARAMNDVPVPTGLKGRILDKLAAARTAEWRRWFLTRVVQPMTAAAAVLFVVSLGSLLYSMLWPVDIDPTWVASRETNIRLTDVKDADEALPELGFLPCAPGFVNYTHLWGQPVRGRVPGYPRLQVPTFYFVERVNGKTGRCAVVYVFKSGQIKHREVVDTGVWRADVYPPEPDGRWDYLILHNSPSWDWLHSAGQPGDEEN
jgi:hypothetical protein